MPRKVVLVVWDGMRRDFINPQLTPNLTALAAKGVFFASHHPAYLSSTEVNGAAISTGTHPGANGIIANAEYRPEINPLDAVSTADTSVVRRGDKISGGLYLKRPTISEILRKNGMETAIAGAKPVSLLHDRLPRPTDSASPVFFAGEVMPAGIQSQLATRFGDFPPYPAFAGQANSARDKYATDVLLQSFWEKEPPAYSVLWLSDPDYSQHTDGPGSSSALASIRHSDQMLGRVVKEIARRGLADNTDILVASDHGFSTIYRGSDLQMHLATAGLKATRRFLKPPEKGEILVVGIGGAALIYVIGHDPELIVKVVSLIQSKDTAGVIFTKLPVAGTFQLADAMIDSPDAPDVVVSMRWKADRSPTGADGLIIAEGPVRGGGGNHVTLGPSDMRNMLVAAGPDFLQGHVSETPSGNVDLAPTVLHILGVRPSNAMDGRILHESFRRSDVAKPVVVTNRLETTVKLMDGRWTQYLERITVGETRYLSEGNGKWEAEGTSRK